MVVVLIFIFGPNLKFYTKQILKKSTDMMRMRNCLFVCLEGLLKTDSRLVLEYLTKSKQVFQTPRLATNLLTKWYMPHCVIPMVEIYC